MQKSASLWPPSLSSREASDCRPEAALGQQIRRSCWRSGGSTWYTMRKSKDKSEVLESTGTFVSISHSLWPTVIFRAWWLHFCLPKLIQIHFCLTQTQNHTGKGIMRNIASWPSLTQNSPAHPWNWFSGFCICIHEKKHHDYWFVFSNTSVRGREGPGEVNANILCLSYQSYRTLCDHMDCSLPGSSVHGISRARILRCHFLLQGIFPTQQWNLNLLHLLHWQVVDSLSLCRHLGRLNANISVTGKVEHLLKVNTLKYVSVSERLSLKLQWNHKICYLVRPGEHFFGFCLWYSNLAGSNVKGRRNSFEFTFFSLSLITLWVKHWRSWK